MGLCGSSVNQVYEANVSAALVKDKVRDIKASGLL
jgi:hypothetical protein